MEEIIKNILVEWNYIYLFQQITDDNLEDFKTLKLEKYQPLMAKVIAVDKKTEAIIATTKLSECWDKSLDVSII